MTKDEENKKTVDKIVSETEYLWVKGETYKFSIGNYVSDFKYEGCMPDGKTLKFRTGNLGLISRLYAKITGKQPGNVQTLNLGEFYSLGRVINTGERFGITPLELVPKNNETDYILKTKLALPKFKKI
ncbi:MAG: hypothetical protein Q8O03_05925 [Nanoarchaeota archaeon]|nr:hypothetical protein [Nanoarchaeota archaeon]